MTETQLFFPQERGEPGKRLKGSLGAVFLLVCTSDHGFDEWIIGGASFGVFPRLPGFSDR